jgi:hypothetical protein
MSTKAGDKAEEVGDSKPLELLARVGLISYGLVHLLIGWSALQIAWGGSAGGSADSSGALSTLAAQPFGRILLGAVAVGLVALALWQASGAMWGYRNSEGASRVREKATSAAKGVAFVALAISASSVALGSGESSSQTQGQATSGVLGWTGGRAIVVVAGLVVIAVGVASVVKGVRRAFREEIDTSSMSTGWQSAVIRLGLVGYVAKGIALSIVGALLGYTAVSFDPAKAQGLDAAVQAILVQPFGGFLLTAVALGFMAFGIFAVIQSGYRRM